MKVAYSSFFDMVAECFSLRYNFFMGKCIEQNEITQGTVIRLLSDFALQNCTEAIEVIGTTVQEAAYDKDPIPINTGNN